MALTNGSEFDKGIWIPTEINIVQTVNGLMSGKIYRCPYCLELELGKQKFCHNCGKPMEVQE